MPVIAVAVNSFCPGDARGTIRNEPVCETSIGSAASVFDLLARDEGCVLLPGCLLAGAVHTETTSTTDPLCECRKGWGWVEMLPQRLIGGMTIPSNV